MPFERSANSSSDCSLMHAKKREGREVENEMQAEEKEEEGRKGGLRGRGEEGGRRKARCQSQRRRRRGGKETSNTGEREKGGIFPSDHGRESQRGKKRRWGEGTFWHTYGKERRDLNAKGKG